MSRSNNTDLISPVVRKFEWSGSEGKIKYFDKDEGEKGTNKMVNLPFSFLVLDRLACITGFCEPDNSGFWSNEVRNTTEDVLTVRTKKGEVAKGLYKQIIGNLRGGQYAQALYILFYDEAKQLQVGKLTLAGSAIGSWIEFCKGRDIFKNAVTIESAVAKKKGSTNYFEPVYKERVVSEDTNKKAFEIDKDLIQPYLEKYLKKPVEKQVEEKQHEAPVQSAHPDIPPPIVSKNEIDQITEPLDDLPF